ncbi:hypothetical protein SNEBB_000943 [Seison nebaliae]|nr:hypothetical protein SNEBB_000943 [Seison nebaliae]
MGPSNLRVNWRKLYGGICDSDDDEDLNESKKYENFENDFIISQLPSSAPTHYNMNFGLENHPEEFLPQNTFELSEQPEKDETMNDNEESQEIFEDSFKNQPVIMKKEYQLEADDSLMDIMNDSFKKFLNDSSFNESVVKSENVNVNQSSMKVDTEMKMDEMFNSFSGEYCDVTNDNNNNALSVIDCNNDKHLLKSLSGEYSLKNKDEQISNGNGLLKDLQIEDESSSDTNDFDFDLHDIINEATQNRQEKNEEDEIFDSMKFDKELLEDHLKNKKTIQERVQQVQIVKNPSIVTSSADYHSAESQFLSEESTKKNLNSNGIVEMDWEDELILDSFVEDSLIDVIKSKFNNSSSSSKMNEVHLKKSHHIVTVLPKPNLGMINIDDDDFDDDVYEQIFKDKKNISNKKVMELSPVKEEISIKLLDDPPKQIDNEDDDDEDDEIYEHFFDDKLVKNKIIENENENREKFSNVSEIKHEERNNNKPSTKIEILTNSNNNLQLVEDEDDDDDIDYDQLFDRPSVKRKETLKRISTFPKSPKPNIDDDDDDIDYSEIFKTNSMKKNEISKNETTPKPEVDDDDDDDDIDYSELFKTNSMKKREISERHSTFSKSPKPQVDDDDDDDDIDYSQFFKTNSMKKRENSKQTSKNENTLIPKLDDKDDDDDDIYEKLYIDDRRNDKNILSDDSDDFKDLDESIFNRAIGSRTSTPFRRNN